MTKQKKSSPRVAYFCMEYGLDSNFKTYAGGLGILAGDYLKGAKEYDHPIIGIGIKWKQGYTDQVIGADGKPYLACISLYSGATNVNFGSGVFGTTALTGTTYADANGHGIFKYSPNQAGASNFDSSAKNFYALNTKNLKEFG